MKISNEINKDNPWYQLGRECSRFFNDEDLRNFLNRNGVYVSINPSAVSGFEKGTFKKFIFVLESKGINTNFLKELYDSYCPNVIGEDMYMFFWGYDIEKLLINKTITFAEATKKWGLGESTLRSVVKSNRLIEGVDYRKSGKIWLITESAMTHLYGEPVKKL